MGEFQEYIDHPKPIQQAPSTIYELILNTVYKKQHSPIKWPKKLHRRIFYILMIPLTHLQFLTIPNPMKEGQDNFYPIALFMASVWILIYSFIIVWFTFEVTQAYQLHFSILPMVLYPFGIAMRDMKRLSDMDLALKSFKAKIPDQKVSLAETFSGPIFQLTGLMGMTWMLFIYFTGKTVSFINEGIQYQMPLLLIVVIVKYVILNTQKYKTSKKLFYINLGGYMIFLVAVILIDYKIEFFGE